MFLVNVTACPIRATSGRMGLSGLVSGGLSSRSIVVVCVQEQIIPSHFGGMGSQEQRVEWTGSELPRTKSAQPPGAATPAEDQGSST